MNKIQKKRLLNVAKSLRDAAKVKELARAFDMKRYGYGTDELANVNGVTEQHKCGTPACAIGHYAARPDLQKKYRLLGSRSKHNAGILAYRNNIRAYFNDNITLDHFGITRTEAQRLFGSYGCNHAKTPIQAAKYIEKFVKNH